MRREEGLPKRRRVKEERASAESSIGQGLQEKKKREKGEEAEEGGSPGDGDTRRSGDGHLGGRREFALVSGRCTTRDEETPLFEIMKGEGEKTRAAALNSVTGGEGKRLLAYRLSQGQGGGQEEEEKRGKEEEGARASRSLPEARPSEGDTPLTHNPLSPYVSEDGASLSVSTRGTRGRRPRAEI